MEHKQRVLLAGAGGDLGSEIGRRLQERGYWVRALCLNRQEKEEARAYSQEQVIGNATNAREIYGLTQNIDIVCSALGNSLNLFAGNSTSFYEVDLQANLNLLLEALKARVGRFVYVSMYHAERNKDAEVPRVHQQFAQHLQASGLDYSVIKPVGLFSGFKNLIMLAKQTGIIPQLGGGHWKTNPIHPADLAELISQHIARGPKSIPAGGPDILSRAEINLMIQEHAVPQATIVPFPRWLASLGMLPIPLFQPVLYDKLAFFYKVSTRDEVAEKQGKKHLADWLKEVDS